MSAKSCNILKYSRTKRSVRYVDKMTDKPGQGYFQIRKKWRFSAGYSRTSTGQSPDTLPDRQDNPPIRGLSVRSCPSAWLFSILYKDF